MREPATWVVLSSFFCQPPEYMHNFLFVMPLRSSGKIIIFVVDGCWIGVCAAQKRWFLCLYSPESGTCTQSSYMRDKSYMRDRFQRAVPTNTTLQPVAISAASCHFCAPIIVVLHSGKEFCEIPMWPDKSIYTSICVGHDPNMKTSKWCCDAKY